MAHAAPSGPLGGRTNPISRNDFNRVILERFVELDANRTIVMNVREGSGVQWYAKVTPTLVLYPNDEETTAGGHPGMRGEHGSETPPEIRTLLRTNSERTFEEAVIHIHGKALLLNFCSPSVEVYPKDSEDCKMIYDMESVKHNHVPEAALANDGALKAYLGEQLRRMEAMPLKLAGEPQLDYALIRRAMLNYREVLKRERVGGMFGTSGWRMAWNKKGKVLARKFDSEDIAGLLRLFNSDLPPGSRLYREESYDPKVEFGAGDYVIIDLEETGQGFALKYDKFGKVLVRTVNEGAFEHTYAALAWRVNLQFT